MIKYTRVYSPSGVLQGILENAVVQYTLKEYPLHSAKLTLPADDPANDICAPHNEVEIFDNGERVERFRILTSPEGSYKAVGGRITYNCEHVLAYLQDSIMYGYHEIGGWRYGGENQSTRACIEYILSKQKVVRWQLGICSFNRQFQYSFNHEHLLPALLSIPKQFDQDYRWTFDTTTTPWTINLVAAETDVSCEMRYARNIQEIKKTWDSSQLCTRIYPLGYGEGNNQLTIKEVNNGIPYIESDTVSTWGVIEDTWADTRFEIAQSLYNRANQILEARKNPLFTYKVSAVDLFHLTGEPFDRFYPGKIVRVNDREHNILVEARVIEISKKDVYGQPGEITVTISNKTQSVADTLAEIASRTSVNELYAQGATNIYEVSFQDNADKDHAAVMKVQIPTECVRINKMRLAWDLSAFRSYSQGAASGGGVQTSSSSGGGNTATSSEGGGATRTSSNGGGETVTTEARVSSTNLAVGAPLDSGSGEIRNNTLANDSPTETGSAGGQTTSAASNHTTSGVSILRTGEESLTTDSDGSGTTGGNGGSTTGCMVSGSYIYTTGSNGGHSHTVNSHSHSGPSHYHSGPSHSHSFSGSVSVGHTHNVTITSFNTSTKTGGASIAGSQSVSGSIGSGGSGSTGYAGTGSTGSSSPGTSETSDHAHSMGHSHGLNDHTHTTPSHSHAVAAHSHSMGHTHTMAHTHTVDAHTHTIATHTHNMRHFHTGAVTINIPELSVTISSHSHSTTIPDHSHTVAIDSHTHDITINPHTHELTPGIYDGPSVTDVTVTVDDNVVPASAIDGNELNIIDYLSKDEDGKILRGTWHTIKLTPVATADNASGLTRIEAVVFVQTFIRSQGGGDY